MSLQMQIKDGIMYMILNTPGSEVNIFDHQAATIIRETMESLHRYPEVEAVVFKSSKPGSFINGAQLLLAAGSVQNAESAQVLSEGIRQAYRSIKNASVPTIAAVQGTCFGCGVEMTLHCDYRFAGDTFDTQFYMTEINDYLLIPTFGSSQILPHLVGLEKAIDFLLWGERWTPQIAKKRGLIHGIFRNKTFDSQLDSFARKIIRRGQKEKKYSSYYHVLKASHRKKIVEQTKSKIISLPPAYHKVYQDCLDLMVQASEKRELHDHDFRTEIVASGKSVATPLAKSAVFFFFMRQTVKGLCLRGVDQQPSKFQLAFPVKTREIQKLQRLIKQRPLEGASLAKLSSPNNSSNILIFAPEKPYARAANKPQIITIFEKLRHFEHGFKLALNQSNHFTLYHPFPVNRPNLVELAFQNEPTETAKSLYVFLTKIGYQVIYSKPKETFAINLWIKAYLRPLLAYCLNGGSPAAVDFTLRHFGFTKRVPQLTSLLNRSELIKMLCDEVQPPGQIAWDNTKIRTHLSRLEGASFHKGHFDQNLINALTVSLLGTAHFCLKEKILGHPTVIDVVARELLDFPLIYGSLCKYLKLPKASELLEKKNQYKMYLTPLHLEWAENFSRTKKEFYL